MAVAEERGYRLERRVLVLAFDRVWDTKDNLTNDVESDVRRDVLRTTEQLSIIWSAPKQRLFWGEPTNTVLAYDWSGDFSRTRPNARPYCWTVKRSLEG
jgi:hypothetical protein